jgi:hypothetical protein
MKKSLSENIKRVKGNSELSALPTVGKVSRTLPSPSKLSIFRLRTEGTYVATPIAAFWNYLVPEYKSKVVGPLVVNLQWDPKYAEQIQEISPKRAGNRVKGYLDSQEMGRVYAKLYSKREASIRFGAEKTGHGYSGERGDFCLVGGVVRGGDLSLFYRSLELIGGFAYDLTLINTLEDVLERHFKFVRIYTTKAFVFALKGNSNEKLFPKLQEIFRD